ncbi:Cro/Cl family transcriptional regulator [Pseudomonas sp. Leaf127]|uniref:helix-turn-helix domain-containing protein n=1 Tax=Pseudomonas sp. Leaf127 TaxID=1736267 RepID=UPI000703B416|nr:helix-turn-helix transcriptional regulator [Pseudomonas sp. Leaf127]KQQ56121.1 Cro/Cl family transcriptional regulator [Pseudomonas sp. Leaf127]
MNSFATRLRQERRALGLTQQKFAALGGVEANAQAMYESAVRIPRSAYLVALSQHGVDVLYLISGRRTPLELDMLSGAEREVITRFRSLAPTQKHAISVLASALSEGVLEQ